MLVLFTPLPPPPTPPLPPPLPPRLFTPVATNSVDGSGSGKRKEGGVNSKVAAAAAVAVAAGVAAAAVPGAAAAAAAAAAAGGGALPAALEGFEGFEARGVWSLGLFAGRPAGVGDPAKGDRMSDMRLLGVPLVAFVTERGRGILRG